MIDYIKIKILKVVLSVMQSVMALESVSLNRYSISYTQKY